MADYVCCRSKCKKPMPNVPHTCRCGATYCSEACFVSAWHSDHIRSCPHADAIKAEASEGVGVLLKKSTARLCATALSRKASGGHGPVQYSPRQAVSSKEENNHDERPNPGSSCDSTQAPSDSTARSMEADSRSDEAVLPAAEEDEQLLHEVEALRKELAETRDAAQLVQHRANNLQIQVDQLAGASSAHQAETLIKDQEIQRLRDDVCALCGERERLQDQLAAAVQAQKEAALEFQAAEEAQKQLTLVGIQTETDLRRQLDELSLREKEALEDAAQLRVELERQQAASMVEPLQPECSGTAQDGIEISDVTGVVLPENLGAARGELQIEEEHQNLRLLEELESPTSSRSPGEVGPSPKNRPRRPVRTDVRRSPGSPSARLGSARIGDGKSGESSGSRLGSAKAAESASRVGIKAAESGSPRMGSKTGESSGSPRLGSARVAEAGRHKKDQTSPPPSSLRGQACRTSVLTGGRQTSSPRPSPINSLRSKIGASSP
uniref:Uncharacterized protein n=1 Tax=Noctiluca scintillans TaxID=2966 RepID=A0A7S1AUS9_NOCSC